MNTITLVVTLTVDGDETEAARLLTEYLTDPEKPYLHDYSAAGTDAGWPGPYTVAVEVSERGIVMGHVDMREPITQPTVHHINSGEVPTVGLRVFTNDWVWGTITKVDSDETYGPKKCGTYCEAWHSVHLDGKPEGSYTIYNCDRLTTRKPQ